MNLKKLTIADLPKLKELIGTKPQKIGFSDTYISNDDYFDYLKLCLTHSLHNTYGYIHEGEIVSFLTTCDFPGLPYYAIINFKVIKKFNTWDPGHNGLIEYQDLFFAKEKEGRYAFYMMRAFKNARLLNKVTARMRANMGELYNRYHLTIEDYVPAGQYSRWEPFNKILFRGHTFNDDNVIYKFSCKQDFRNNVPTEVQQHFLTAEEITRTDRQTPDTE